MPDNNFLDYVDQRDNALDRRLRAIETLLGGVDLNAGGKAGDALAAQIVSEIVGSLSRLALPVLSLQEIREQEAELKKSIASPALIALTPGSNARQNQTEARIWIPSEGRWFVITGQFENPD